MNKLKAIKINNKNQGARIKYILPVSIGGLLVFGLNVHKQITSTVMMAMKSMPAPIPIIGDKFECLPLFEPLSDVAAGVWSVGAFIGDAATVGAAIT